MNGEYGCRGCGEYTTRCGPFGELLCEECHQREDDDIEVVERREARERGYRYGWREED